MNTTNFLLTVACLLLASCTSRNTADVLHITPPLDKEDSRLAFDFLHALYKPSTATHRIIIDVSEPWHGWSQAKRRAELAARLKLLRQGSQPLRVAIESGDQPHPYGSGFLVGLYHKPDGRFDVIQPAFVKDRADVWLDIRHWPNGIRLVSLMDERLKDDLDDTFHISPNTSTFRFVHSILPPLTPATPHGMTGADET